MPQSTREITIPPVVDLTHKPIVLYHASIERMNTARQLLGRAEPDCVMAMYLAGLAVECLLQAFALRKGEPHDARHSLTRWLIGCPADVQHAIGQQARDQWSQLISLWDNRLRYLSTAGLLGYLRSKKCTHGISGGPDAIIRVNARRLIDAAQAVQKAGLALWVK